jgi:SAM-dependent methyltransferase
VPERDAEAIDEATRRMATRWLDDLSTDPAMVDGAADLYGDAFADVYDEWYPDRGDTAAAVDLLVELALAVPHVTATGRATVLELGAGTGRLAIPLAARIGRGAVVALDSSAAMLDRLRGKPGSALVTCVLGDMGGELPAGPFLLVVIAANTLFNLAAPGAHERCVANVASRLVPGGCLVVEAFVPDDSATNGDRVSVRSVANRHDPAGIARTVLTVSRTDVDEQLVVGSHLEVADGTVVRARPWKVRWKSPAQVDAMCIAAGLTLEQRVSSWSRSSFDGESIEHVSVYRCATA